MPLTTQNDQGTATGANAYIDIAYADAYFLDRGFESEWGDRDDEEKEAAIIKATSYIDNSNIGKFKGAKLTRAQLTQFPRSNLTDIDGYIVDGLPEFLKMATAEYAFRALDASLAPDPVYSESGNPIKSTKEKIGQLEESVTYQDNVFQPNTLRAYPEADMLIAQYKMLVNQIMRA